jgi:hypothetical protein
MFIAAGTYMEMGDGEKALTFARPGVELARRIEDRATEAWSRLMVAGSVSIEDISSVEAREQIDTAVALARELEDDFLLGYSLSFQGAVRTLDGEFGEALACHEESLELARGLDNKVLQTQATSQMAMTHLAAGDRAEARTALEAGLDQVDDVRSLEALALYLDAVAWLAFAESNTVRAMTALGAANSTRARVGAARWATVAGLLEAAGLAAEGSQPALADARRAGSEMSPHDAIAFAIQPPRELATAS